jgi:hypothetical protein
MHELIFLTYRNVLESTYSEKKIPGVPGILMVFYTNLIY